MPAYQRAYAWNEAIARDDGAWDEVFVGVRSQRLAELAWDRMWVWLAPALIAPARRGRR